MKHLFLLTILLLTFASNICNAQQDTTKRKVFSFSVRAGFNASNRLGADEFASRDYHWHHSFNVGATCDFRKSKKFLGRTGIYYTEKGFNELSTLYTNLNYLEMPMLAVFQLPVGKVVKFEMQVGLFFAYGVGGKRNMHVSDPVYIEEYDVYDYDHFKYVEIPNFKDSDWDKAEYKRFDTGINLGFGINFSRFCIGASYDLSIGHEHRNSNHCLMIDLGYTF